MILLGHILAVANNYKEGYENRLLKFAEKRHKMNQNILYVIIGGLLYCIIIRPVLRALFTRNTSPSSQMPLATSNSQTPAGSGVAQPGLNLGAEGYELIRGSEYTWSKWIDAAEEGNTEVLLILMKRLGFEPESCRERVLNLFRSIDGEHLKQHPQKGNKKTTGLYSFSQRLGRVIY
jgi:hypothetical protein